MKKQFLKFVPAFTLLVTGSMLFSSCEPEGTTYTGNVEPAFTDGFLVTSEGQFQKGNGDVTFIEKGGKNVIQDLFAKVNSRPAGDIIQSMAFSDVNGYIIANNSAKIEVVNARTFKSTGVIGNLKQPRYMLVANNTGYVTEHVAYGVPGQVSVIDLGNNTVIKTLPAGIAPERMVLLNNKLYVANSGDNFISVINTNTNLVEDSIMVTAGPGNLIVDANNKIWALSAMSFSGNAGALSRINPATNKVEFTLDFTEPTNAFRSDLKTNAPRNTLYFSYAGKVYKRGITETNLPTPFINRDFYSIAIDPENKMFYGGAALDMVSRGRVVMYNASGLAVDSVTVGIAPNDFYFR